MRKLMSLVLVIIMLVSVLPLAAFADDDVEAYAGTTRCGACGSYNTRAYVKCVPGKAYPSGQCDNTNNPMVHNHRVDSFYDVFECIACGDMDDNNFLYTKIYCVERGRYIN